MTLGWPGSSSLLDTGLPFGYERHMAADSRVLGEPRPTTARELQAVLHAEREGAPFFVHRDGAGELRIVCFGPDRREFTVGRNPSADLSLGWDDQVSGLHAIIARQAGELTLRDDGLSRNGSYVNGERVLGMRRLRNRDLLRFGRTVVLIQNPVEVERSATSPAPMPLRPPDISEQQRKVLSVLCRPVNDPTALAAPATNQEIAEELHLSVGAVKLHLRALFDKFGIAHLPQNQKRLALVRLALESGLISSELVSARTPDRAARS
jgi:pSer/pThr/pTyr-binding forkhead associated (FHA) protein